MILHDEPAEVWRCITSWGEEFCAPATVKRGAERKATAHGDVYFRRPHAPFNFVSDAATDLCRRLKAIKRGDEVSSAYWVQESLQWRRLVIYNESAKTVEDTVRAVLGRRGGDYAEDDWDEESVERSRAHGRHAHRVEFNYHNCGVGDA